MSSLILRTTPLPHKVHPPLSFFPTVFYQHLREKLLLLEYKNTGFDHMRSKRIDRKSQQYITHERMVSLFTFAEAQYKTGHPERSQWYMAHVLRLSTKNRTPLPAQWKQRMCKRCHHFLIPGENCRVRIHRGKVILFCMNCSRYHRIPLRKR